MTDLTGMAAQLAEALTDTLDVEQIGYLALLDALASAGVTLTPDTDGEASHALRNRGGNGGGVGAVVSSFPTGKSRDESAAATTADRDAAEVRAANWKPFVLLRTVIEQSPSSLRTEALIVLAQLQKRVEDAEALGDA